MTTTDTILTERETRLIQGVLAELCRKPYSELNTVFGSVTITEMQTLLSKLDCKPYCDRHGIRFEDMTDADFEAAYYEDLED